MAAVLVAYATKYGSTHDAAEVVASTLVKRGIDVAVRPAGEVRSLDGYSAVVLGTALYFFMWRGEAHRFIRHNRHALSTMPVALFGLGPIEDTPEQFEGARGHFGKGLSKHAWLSPVSTAVFGGRLDPERLRFPHNNPAMRAMAPVDLLGLDAVRVWADSLVGPLGLEARSGS